MGPSPAPVGVLLSFTIAAAVRDRRQRALREFKDSVTGVEEAVTITEPAPKPVELPAATSEPDAPASASEAEAERETVR